MPKQNNENKPEVIGGPMAHALAHWLKQVMDDQPSADMDFVQVDSDGNEVSRHRLKNVELLRVEVTDEGPPLDTVTLRYDQIMPHPTEEIDSAEAEV